MTDISKIIKQYFKDNPDELIQVSQYHENAKYEFTHNNTNYKIVVPNNPSGNKWIYRTEFFGAFDYVDAAMVNKGYYLATAVISDMYGCDEAINLMNEFYEFMTNTFMLNLKTILFGFSRGGLYATNFAIKYPNKVQSMYLDAPVIDISSWPGGEGKGVGSANEYIDCKKILHIENDDDMKKYKANLNKKLDFLVTCNIPTIIVYGNVDDVVVFEENAKLLIDKYGENNVNICVIEKDKIAHHPHSLENPEKIIEFLEN